MEFTPTPSTVGGLLQSEKFYSIPKYQREYVWADQKIQELLDDIVFCLNNSKFPKYFLGSFIVRTGEANQEYIIDGQQRLTSLLILLGVICKEFINLGDNFNIDYTKKYCVLGNVTNQQVKSRLLNDDHAILEIIIAYCVNVTQCNTLENYLTILGQKVGKPDKRFLSCYKIYYDYIQSIIANKNTYEKLEILENLRDIILKISIVKIQVEDSQTASLVFETINARGQTLEVQDLIKNYLFMYEAPVGGRNLFETKWETIISIIASCKDASMSRFCTHYCTTFFGKRKRGDIYKAYKENTPRDKVLERINSIEEVANIYKHIVDGKDNNIAHKELNHYLDCLNRLGVSILRPFLIALLSAYKHNKIDYKTLCNELKKVTAFFSIYVGVCSIKTNTIEDLIYKAAEELNKNFSVAALKIFVSKLIAKKPTYEVFNKSFIKIAFSNHKNLYSDVVINKGKAQYILYIYELFKQNNEDFSVATFSIEHIKDDETGGNACYIGNLVPLPPRKNSNLAGKSYSDKILAYKASCFSSTRSFATSYNHDTQNSWEDEDIITRGNNLAKEFYNTIWKI